MLESMGSQRVGHNSVSKQQNSVCLFSLIFVYMVVPGLGCGTRSSVSVAACRIFSCGMWDLVLGPGIKLRLLHVERRILAIGPPGKSLQVSS